jgi:DNA-binding CsgD family transcriptional regulator
MRDAVDELENAAAVCGRIRFSEHEAGHALLEPLSGLLGADMGAFRIFSANGTGIQLTTLLTLGIPDRVNDAYATRYSGMDPMRCVLHRHLAGPLFAEDGHPREARADDAIAPVPAGTEVPRRFRQDLVRYRREFLRPNRLAHHLGFYFQEPRWNHTFLFDFHRAPSVAPFGRIELARARIAALLLHARSGAFHAPDSEERTTASHDATGSGDRLSAREREIAEAVARGLSHKEIASRTGISARTVENHLRSIFAKTGVSSRTRLTARMLGRNLKHCSG